MVVNLGGKVMLRKMAVGLAYFVGVSLLSLLGTGVSVAADKPVRLTFTNNTDGDFELFWLDTSKGKEVTYGLVRKGETRDQDTFNDQVWVIRSPRGEELGRYTVKTPGSAAAFALAGSQADLVRRNKQVQDLAAIKAEMIRLTNVERAKANLAPVVEDARLSRAAQKHTERMAQQQTLDHKLGGTSPGDRVDAEKYNWRAVDEIINRADQKEAADAAKVIQSWMRSTEGDRDAILTSKCTQIGVGIAYSATGVPYYTEVFARPTQADEVTAIPEEVRKKFELDTTFYKKHLDYKGFSILSSAKVSDEALVEARYLIDKLLGDREDILKAMLKNGCRFMVMAPSEMTTDVPEQRGMKNDTKVNWDERARGLGGKLASCGEENLLNLQGDRYNSENVLIHEFNHAIHEHGLSDVNPTFDRRLQQAYEKAMAKGLWKGTYLTDNRYEYWAEGTQAYFDCMRPDFGANTREKLKAYDPDLFNLVDEVYKQSKFRYVRYDRR
jgi:alpha-glucosidase